MSALTRTAARIPPALSAGEVALRCAGVRLRIGAAEVLRDVDLEVRAGELVALVGPNGAGKSTLVSALAGDLAVQGEVEVAGRPVGAWPVAELARLRAMLPQQNALAFPFPVRAVVEMGRAPWRRTPLEDDDEAAVQDALDRMDVAALADRPFPSLSGGERARVSLARVLAQRTGILLLDEPTAALDIRHQEDVLRVARERADAGDAVVVVLHDLSLAAGWADRVALLSDGRVVAIGSPEDVLTAERVTEVYRHPVTVIPHPGSGTPVVLPRRDPRSVPGAAPQKAER